MRVANRGLFFFSPVIYSDYVARLGGGDPIPGGWVNHNYIQLAYQLADAVAGFSYSFGMTCVILFLMNLVPGLSLRASPGEEDTGLDDGQLGEFAYDYVELSRHVNDFLPGEDHTFSSRAGSIKAGSANNGAPAPVTPEKIV